jgi:5'-3' exonuclease
MKLGKHTLMIDGNYFVYSRLYVMPRSKSGKLLGDEKEKAQFLRKLCIDIASEIRKMRPFIDQVVVAVDSKSWRKDLFPEAEYKGTRTPDDSVDWDAVYEMYDTFRNVLQKQGVIVQQTNGAEADDILFAWSTELNNQGRNCIVWTGDRDLIQLVDYTQATDGYTLWYYNTKRNLIAFNGFTDLLQSESNDTVSDDDLLFNMSGSDITGSLKDDINDWVKRNRVTIEEIDSREFVFKKILIGDKSDNIPSVVTYDKQQSNGKYRTFSITERQSEKILAQYQKDFGSFEVEHLFIKENRQHMCDVIYRTVGNSSLEQIAANLMQNIQLMFLHVRIIPEPILKAIYREISKPYDGPNFHNLSQMERILEGTGYTDRDKQSVPQGMDPFSGLKLVDEKPTKQDQPKTKKLNELF